MKNIRYLVVWIIFFVDFLQHTPCPACTLSHVLYTHSQLATHFPVYILICVYAIQPNCCCIDVDFRQPAIICCVEISYLVRSNAILSSVI